MTMQINLLFVGALLVFRFATGVEKRPNPKFFNLDAPEFETFLTPADFAAMSEPADENAKEIEGELTTYDAMYNPKMFEGDIANELNSTTVPIFINGGPTIGQKDDVQLNAIRDRRQLWKNGRIPYALSNQYTAQSRAIIASAMHEYAQHTCIQWVPRAQYDNDYIYIHPDRGCYSMVGRMGGRQILSLGTGCIQKGTIMHEMMHATGFFHEQSRTDRDSFVTVLWNNIQPGMQGQFEKYTPATIQTLGTNYDYQSIMHYDQAAFSRNGLPTIVPKSNVQIGQRGGFSQMDAYKINRLYECTSSPSSQLTTPPPVVSYTTVSMITQQSKAKNYTRFLPLVSSAKCVNRRPDCDQLARDGWCTKNGGYMRDHCPVSCNLCEKSNGDSCEDLRVDCLELVKLRYCISQREFARDVCARSCGFCFAPPPIEEAARTTITAAPRVVPTLPSVVAQTTTKTGAPPIACRDKNFRCVQWKKAGYCRGHYSAYMKETCARSCEWCRNLAPN